jgi:hypothetical protein
VTRDHPVPFSFRVWHKVYDFIRKICRIWWGWFPKIPPTHRLDRPRTRDHSAWLVVHLDITGPVPVFIGAGIKNEGGFYIGSGYITFGVHQEWGYSFEDARDRIVRGCKEVTPLRWAVPWIDETTSKKLEMAFKAQRISDYAKTLEVLDS